MTDVVANADAADRGRTAVDQDGDGTISVSEAAHSDRTGGVNCNHGGYVSSVAHGTCDATTDAMTTPRTDADDRVTRPKPTAGRRPSADCADRRGPPRSTAEEEPPPSEQATDENRPRSPADEPEPSPRTTTTEVANERPRQGRLARSPESGRRRRQELQPRRRRQRGGPPGQRRPQGGSRRGQGSPEAAARRAKPARRHAKLERPPRVPGKGKGLSH